MADNNQLAAVLSGSDPLSPEILQAIHNEQGREYVQNPANWQGGGLFGGLARLFAGAMVPNNGPTVSDLAAQRVAAQPDLAKLLSSPNPYAAIGANPSAYSPLAVSMILNGSTPENVADIAQKRAAANLANTQAGFTGARISLANAPNPTTEGAPPAPSVPSGNVTSFGMGRFPQTQIDPVAQAAGMTLQQRQQMLQNPAMRNAILMRLRALSQPTSPVAGASGSAP